MMLGRSGNDTRLLLLLLIIRSSCSCDDFIGWGQLIYRMMGFQEEKEKPCQSDAEEPPRRDSAGEAHS